MTNKKRRKEKKRKEKKRKEKKFDMEPPRMPHPGSFSSWF